jgi:hypothetical protein
MDKIAHDSFITIEKQIAKMKKPGFVIIFISIMINP